MVTEQDYEMGRTLRKYFNKLSIIHQRDYIQNLALLPRAIFQKIEIALFHTLLPPAKYFAVIVIHLCFQHLLSTTWGKPRKDFKPQGAELVKG